MRSKHRSKHSHQIIRRGCQECTNLLIKWENRLAMEGLGTIETPSGILKKCGPDQELISTQNAERILDFYRRLDSFLTHSELPRRDRRILDYYTEGTHIVEIVRKTGIPIATVERVIYKYKKILLDG